MDIDEQIEEIDSILADSNTTSEELDEIANVHMNCDDCEICSIFIGEQESILDLLAGHLNCSDSTFDGLMEWAFKSGDSFRFIDLLFPALARHNTPNKWLDFAIDKDWVTNGYYEDGTLAPFLRNIQQNRILTDEQKSRIMKANELDSWPE